MLMHNWKNIPILSIMCTNLKKIHKNGISSFKNFLMSKIKYVKIQDKQKLL